MNKQQFRVLAEIFKPSKEKYVYAHYDGKIQLIPKKWLKKKKHVKLLG